MFLFYLKEALTDEELQNESKNWETGGKTNDCDQYDCLLFYSKSSKSSNFWRSL